MKNTLLYIFLFGSITTFAQVGVNTIDPQEELHVAGPTSTIRVEGLDLTNNTLNLGSEENTRVYVDTNGDLVLGDGATDIEVLFNPPNYLEDPLTTGGSTANQIIQDGGGGGYSQAGWPRQSGPGLDTFTLTRNAIVEINYSLSYDVYINNNSYVDDYHARTIQFYVYLREGGPDQVNQGPNQDITLVDVDVDGTPIIFAGNRGSLGYNGQFYTNGSQIGASGGEGFDRRFYATGHDYIKLGPGTYSPMFAGNIFVTSTVGSGAAKMQIGGGDDEIVVVAHYYN